MRKNLATLFVLMVSVSVQSAVVVQPTNLNTPESGSSVMYRVVLDSPPAAGEIVTITPSSSDVTEGTVSGALVFDLSNYDQAQYITVTPGASGDGNDGDVMYSIMNTVSSNQMGGNYDGQMAPNVSAYNQNIDGVGAILIDPSSGFFVTEGNSQAVTIEVGPDVTPASDITIAISTMSTDVTLSAASVVLTAGNGYSSSITVTAIDDALVNGDVAFSLITDTSVSADANFNGVNPFDINGLTLDNDVAAVIPPTPVPFLGSWAIVLLCLSLIGILFLNRKREFN